MKQASVEHWLKKYEPLVKKLAASIERQLKQSGIVVEYDDLVSEIRLEILRAIQDYREGRGATLDTWVFTRVINFSRRRLLEGRGHGGSFADRRVSFRSGNAWVKYGRPAVSSSIETENHDGELVDPIESGVSVFSNGEVISEETMAIGRAILREYRKDMRGRYGKVLDAILNGENVSKRDESRLIAYIRKRLGGHVV